jgi:hypothetical protein
MTVETKPETAGFIAGKSAAPSKKTNPAATPKVEPLAKTSKVARASRRSRDASRVEKLICRYCGSDDLAPSFRKRRDARCRACFKKRYGSASRRGKGVRSGKAQAAKK